MQLGSSFSVQAKATTLVTTGVYSRIRNPIYIFGAMFVLGIIIWMGRPWLLLIFAVMIPLAGGAEQQILRVVPGTLQQHHDNARHDSKLDGLESGFERL